MIVPEISTHGLGICAGHAKLPDDIALHLGLYLVKQTGRGRIERVVEIKNPDVYRTFLHHLGILVKQAT